MSRVGVGATVAKSGAGAASAGAAAGRGFFVFGTVSCALARSVLTRPSPDAGSDSCRRIDPITWRSVVRP